MHPNAQAVMRGFKAFAEGDMAAMKQLFSDDASWHVAGRNKWSGRYTGPDSIVQYMSSIGSEATIDNQPHAAFADDDHVVVLGKSSAKRNGKAFSGNVVYVFHVTDGQITEAWVTPGDQYGQDEFWAD